MLGEKGGKSAVYGGVFKLKKGEKLFVRVSPFLVRFVCAADVTALIHREYCVRIGH